MYVDQNITTPLYIQIYEQCKLNITSGAYPAGEKLTPIRKLAEELGVARNTVETAYRQLVQEGFVSSRSGSGYIVEPLNLDEMAFLSSRDTSFVLSDSPENTLEQNLSSYLYDFTYGNLERGTFPAELWRKLTTEALFSEESTDISCYNDNRGDYLLRLNIAKHLRKSRGVYCSPEQIIIQAGTQASLQNLLQLFDPTQDTIAMEDPGYDGVRMVFEGGRFKVVPCSVYRGNVHFMQLIRESEAKLAFVTPSSQFPTGTVMTMGARQHLLYWARTNDAYIIEDDYCREFHYNTRPAPALQSLDAHDRVIYMGTFSKALSPALRMNYLILPPALLQKWNEVFGEYYSTVPWLSQVVLRKFLERGHWDKLLRQARTRNKRKHDLLIQTLKASMGDKITLMEGGAGLHILVSTVDGRSQETLIDLAAHEGVRVYSTERYWIAKRPPKNNYVLIGFSAIEEEKIVPGVEALAKAWFE